MASQYRATMFTPGVRAAQARNFGRAQAAGPAPDRDPLTPDEVEFIGRRDSFYLGTVSETGWPYIQHRGGPPGFLKVIDPHTLAFADYNGNRQLLTTGHLTASDKVSLFLMDYPRQERLKIIGHARVETAASRPDLAALFPELRTSAASGRIFVIDVLSFDWNCPQFITPRYTEAEVREMVAPLQQRIAALEAERLAARAPLPPDNQTFS